MPRPAQSLHHALSRQSRRPFLKKGRHPKKSHRDKKEKRDKKKTRGARTNEGEMEDTELQTGRGPRRRHHHSFRSQASVRGRQRRRPLSPHHGTLGGRRAHGETFRPTAAAAAAQAAEAQDPIGAFMLRHQRCRREEVRRSPPLRPLRRQEHALRSACAAASR